MKEQFLTLLRDETTSTEAFRKAATQLAALLAAESGQFLTFKVRTVTTPMGQTKGSYLEKQPILIPILRAGLTLLPSFVQLYSGSPIGFIGLKRNELTAEPRLYYCNLPALDNDDPIFLLDPMIATGQSAALAISLLKEAGAKESNIILISILAAPEGIAHIETHCPQITIQVVKIDERLDPKKWIVPGLGDFGDRYFGT